MGPVVSHLDQAQLGDVAADGGLGHLDVPLREQLHQLVLAADRPAGHELVDLPLALTFGGPGAARPAPPGAGVGGILWAKGSFPSCRSIRSSGRIYAVSRLYGLLESEYLHSHGGYLRGGAASRYAPRLMQPYDIHMAMPSAPPGSDGA